MGTTSDHINTTCEAATYSKQSSVTRLRCTQIAMSDCLGHELLILITNVLNEVLSVVMIESCLFSGVMADFFHTYQRRVLRVRTVVLRTSGPCILNVVLSDDRNPLILLGIIFFNCWQCPFVLVTD